MPHYYRFTLQWQIDSIGENGTLQFAPGGGTQGSEGWHADGATGDWAVENALELLDAENEFYHDVENEILYWAPNSTDGGVDGGADGGADGAPGADALVAVRGKVILSVTGTQAQPVRNLTLLNLVFRVCPNLTLLHHTTFILLS
jgi:hypothetical protein